jgi:hypothetical protein
MTRRAELVPDEPPTAWSAAKELRRDPDTAALAPPDPRKRRLRVGKTTAAIVLVGGLAAGGVGLAAATSSSGPPPKYSGPDMARYFPDRVPVAGPNGIAGYVPRDDLLGPPPVAGPIPVADTAGASVVVGGNAGYPVTSAAGKLVGYWVPPLGFLTIAQAEAKGATPAHGAGPVGSG